MDRRPASPPPRPKNLQALPAATRPQRLFLAAAILSLIVWIILLVTLALRS